MEESVECDMQEEIEVEAMFEKQQQERQWLRSKISKKH